MPETGTTHIIVGGAGNDTISGDAGNDAIYGDDQLAPTDPSADASPYGGSDTIVGAGGNDRIWAGGGDDSITTGSGRDLIWAGRGDDDITSGGGDDAIFGEAGDDTIDAGVGSDLVVGGGGDDTITGGRGSDLLYGDSYTGPIDATRGIPDQTTISALFVRPEDEGDDLIEAGLLSLGVVDASAADPDSKNTIDAGGGDDTIYGDAGIDIIVAGPETLLSASDDDVVWGYAGADTIRGGAGNDEIRGGLGSDTIVGGAGRDTIYGGESAVGSGTASAQDRNLIYGDFDNAASAAAGESETAFIDVIYGDWGADTIRAGLGADIVDALAGNDGVYGESGGDTLSGGDGDDFIAGGTGDDTISGGDGRDAIWGGDPGFREDEWRIDLSQFKPEAATSTAYDFATNFPGGEWTVTEGMQRIVPRRLAGRSIDGGVADGDNRISGGEGTDWIFGGGGDDTIGGGNDADYVDGGAGNDTIDGNAGDDTVRGGGNNDSVSGGAGIDQVFGDDGEDALFGNGGTLPTGSSNNATQVVENQRLFGGSGIDRLYGWSYSMPNQTGAEAESELKGDEMHGGSGGDWIYGGIRRETIYGDAGADTVQGDAVYGENYAENTNVRWGGADIIYGGTGEDKLYGNAGDDELWGGADSDWLEGQAGADKLYGGEGIDKLVLDVDPRYALDAGKDAGKTETFDGHYGNQSYNDVRDEASTDILVVNGTVDDDTILLGQNAQDQLVAYVKTGSSEQLVTATWRDARVPLSSTKPGTPRIEQFAISGLDGNDTLGFYGATTSVTIGNTTTSIAPLFVSDISDRSADWVGAIDAGPGNDTVQGSGARDRIDGGRGSDTIFGYGGDDQLWGDAGAGFGDPTDFDRLYGGEGNDDLLGGQGFNQLSAWTSDPDRGLGELQLHSGVSSTPTDTSPSASHVLTASLPLPVDGRLRSGAVFQIVKLSNAGSPITVTVPVDPSLSSRASLVEKLNKTPSAPATRILPAGITASLALDGSGRLVLTATAAFGSFRVDRVEAFGIFTKKAAEPIAGVALSAGVRTITLTAEQISPLSPGMLVADANGAALIPLGTVITAIDRTQRTLTLSRAVQAGTTTLNFFYPEETGLNRVLGGKQTAAPQHDDLYGGTGLDFLYGNGAAKESPDVLYDRTGGLFQARNAIAGDEWKAYAKSTDKVWYYGGTNKDDLITVDYVTEPGLLTGHHLITRSTNNNGYFTFDAQVRLDFGARDASGKLIWNPDRAFAGLAAVGRQPMAFDEDLLGVISDPLTFAVAVDAGEPVPVYVAATPTDKRAGRTIGDLIGDINKALDAVPALKGSVAVRQNGDRLAFVRLSSSEAPGSALFISYANDAARRLGIAVPVDANDESGLQEAVLGVVGERGMESLLPGEGDFAAIIIDALDGNDTIRVGPTVVKSVWVDAGKGDDRVEYVSGRPILIDQAETKGIARNDSWQQAYSLTGSSAAGLPQGLAGNLLFTGLTLDSPTDEDWYSFTLDPSRPPSTLRLSSISPQDRITIEIRDPAQLTDGQPTLVQPPEKQPLTKTQDPTNPVGILELSLADLTKGKRYLLHVKSDRVPTVYELEVSSAATSVGTADQPIKIAAALAGADVQKIKQNATVADISTIVGVPVTRASQPVFYELKLPIAAFDKTGTAKLTLEAYNNSQPVTFSLLQSNPKLGSKSDISSTTEAGSTAAINLKDISLPADATDPVTVWLKVSSNAAAQYVIRPTLPAADGVLPSVPLDFAGQKQISLASLTTINRRDVILGGEGNDVLQGGPGEDWIFGGPGDDVISGGFDRQAPDLMWGEGGNDTFQILTDRLMSTRAALARVGAAGQDTIRSTTTDQFDGGDGTDTVFFMGGDLDSQGREVPDDVAVRWNTILQRYEATSRVWNPDKQQFEAVAVKRAAVVTVPVALPSDGRIGRTNPTAEIPIFDESAAIGFTIAFPDPDDATAPWRKLALFATATETASFTSPRDLATLFQRRIAEAGWSGSVGVRCIEGQLQVYTVESFDPSDTVRLQVGLNSTGDGRSFVKLDQSLTSNKLPQTGVPTEDQPFGRLAEDVSLSLLVQGWKEPIRIDIKASQTAGFTKASNQDADPLTRLTTLVNTQLKIAGVGSLLQATVVNTGTATAANLVLTLSSTSASAGFAMLASDSRNQLKFKTADGLLPIATSLDFTQAQRDTSRAPEPAPKLTFDAASNGVYTQANAKPSYRQDFAAFTVQGTERFVIDTRSGNDAVHANPEYLINDSEWGIKVGDKQQGAPITDLVIRGGAGDDWLYGGAGNDSIEGGEGNDTILGDAGNDRLDGGSGDDWISGGGATKPNGIGPTLPTGNPTALGTSVYQVEPAKPVTAGPIPTSTAMPITLTTGATKQVVSAAVLTAAAPTSKASRLTALRAIGDINGDGRNDFYASDEGVGEGYIFFGPLNLSGSQSVRDAADVVVSLSAFGNLVERSGDVSVPDVTDKVTDILDDLVFVKFTLTATNTYSAIVTTITPTKGNPWPRSLPEVRTTTASPFKLVMWQTQVDSITSTSRPATSLLDWDGAINAATQRGRSELAIITPTLTRIYPFSGSATDELPVTMESATFATWTTTTAPVVIGDVNGDGCDDLGIVSAAGIQIALGGGTGVLSTKTVANTTAAADTTRKLTALGDLNADGYDDFAVVSQTIVSDKVTAQSLDIFLGADPKTSVAPVKLASFTLATSTATENATS